MKIIPSIAAHAFLNQVREKPDSEGGRNNRQGGSGGQQRQESDEPEPGEETIDAAIEAFQKDPQAVASGLHAVRSGQGPGLRVVLKNGTGAVVRQLSGEEFVKLREATASGGPRGKILDRKL